MSMLLDAAMHIQTTLPTLGGQALNDAERDLSDLRSCAKILARLGVGDVGPNDAGILKEIVASVEERRQEWAASVEEAIKVKYDYTDLAYVEGTDACDASMAIETSNLGTTEQVNVYIDGVCHSLPSSEIAHEGEALTIGDGAGGTLLDLPLRDVAAFGYVSDCGEDEFGNPVWSGFDVLTIDNRLISLR